MNMYTEIKNGSLTIGLSESNSILSKPTVSNETTLASPSPLPESYKYWNIFIPNWLLNNNYCIISESNDLSNYTKTFEGKLFLDLLNSNLNSIKEICLHKDDVEEIVFTIKVENNENKLYVLECMIKKSCVNIGNVMITPNGIRSGISKSDIENYIDKIYVTKINNEPINDCILVRNDSQLAKDFEERKLKCEQRSTIEFEEELKFIQFYDDLIVGIKHIEHLANLVGYYSEVKEEELKTFSKMVKHFRKKYSNKS